ncbi:putative Arginine/ornithine antiporter ArcD [Streptomyces misionensis JCM 4497]
MAHDVHMIQSALRTPGGSRAHEQSPTAVPQNRSRRRGRRGGGRWHHARRGGRPARPGRRRRRPRPDRNPSDRLPRLDHVQRVARRHLPGHPGGVRAPPRRGARRPRGQHRLHRPAHRHHRHMGVRHLDLPPPPPRGAGHRGRLLLERAHPRGHLDPDRAVRHLLGRLRHPLVRDGPLGGRRPGHQADLGGRAERRQEQRLDRHLRHRRRLDRSAPGLLPAAPDPVPQAGHRAHPDRLAARRDGLRHPRPLHGPGLHARPRPGTGRTALLAGDPQGPVPAVRQRRRGLVQPHLVTDDHRVLGRPARPRAVVLGRPVLRRPAGGRGRPLHVRLPVPGLRQLAVQRRLRGHLQGPPGRDHPARLAHRPGDAGRGRHPGHNVPVVPEDRTDRGGLRHLGPSDDRDRLHRGRRCDRQRPGLAERRRRTTGLQAAGVREHLAQDQAVQRLRRRGVRHRRRLLPLLPGPAERPSAQGPGRGGRALTV